MSTESPQERLARLNEMLEEWVAEYGAVERDHPEFAQDYADAICDLHTLIARVQRESLPGATPMW